jgi:hypothetical protein
VRYDTEGSASDLTPSIGAVAMSAEHDHIGPNPIREGTNDMRGIADGEMQRNVAELEAGAIHELSELILAVAALSVRRCVGGRDGRFHVYDVQRRTRRGGQLLRAAKERDGRVVEVDRDEDGFETE